MVERNLNSTSLVISRRCLNMSNSQLLIILKMESFKLIYDKYNVLIILSAFYVFLQTLVMKIQKNSLL